MIRRLLACVAIMVLLQGCALFEKDFFTPQVNAAESALDDAIAKISASSSSWLTALDELKKAVANLTVEGAEIIRTEVQQLSERTVAAVGVEFRCEVDFLGNRVLDGLNRIKSKLADKEVPLPPPRFCSVSPGEIDMKLEPERRNHVQFTGYDFRQPGMKLLLTTAAGVVDVSRHLSLQSPYHGTINLSGSQPDQGIQLDESTRTLQIMWGDNAFVPTIPVLHRPPTPRCEVRLVDTEPTSFTVQAVHTGEGDKEIFGKGDVTIRVWREGDDQLVAARVFFKVRQYDDDHSTGEATSPSIELFRADPGTRIVNVAAPLEEAPDDYRDTDWEDDYIGGGGGLVRQYVVRAEGPREDLNGHAQVTVDFNSFKVAVIPASGCTY